MWITRAGRTGLVDDSKFRPPAEVTHGPVAATGRPGSSSLDLSRDLASDLPPVSAGYAGANRRDPRLPELQRLVNGQIENGDALTAARLVMPLLKTASDPSVRMLGRQMLVEAVNDPSFGQGEYSGSLHNLLGETMSPTKWANMDHNSRGAFFAETCRRIQNQIDTDPVGAVENAIKLTEATGDGQVGRTAQELIREALPSLR